MTGWDGLGWCAGVASIIMALGFVRCIPDILALVERILIREQEARRPRALPSEKPWGERR